MLEPVSEMRHHALNGHKKNPHSTEEEKCQIDIELDGLEKENEGMKNKSRTE